jgi:hypothetical protein
VGVEYISSVTGGVAIALSGNPGYTYLETYIAGISPDSAEQFVLSQTGPHSLEWDAKPSRAYDVLWSTNFPAGFTPPASNLVNQSVFSDATSRTNLPAGFYRLQVQVNDDL